VPPLATDDAVQLFVARAHAAGVPLALSDDLAPVVSEICLRLDGLPLAIELAAARTRAFPVQQIASRLNDRFRLLTGGSRTALPRQQTLRAVVDWSYELLFDDEQRIFERLSVFPGGCDLATAEAVCVDESLGASELADIVQALVDKSLVIALPTGDDVRFVQLQTLAQYGREKLAERGDAERVRDAMAAHFARLCARRPRTPDRCQSSDSSNARATRRSAVSTPSVKLSYIGARTASNSLLRLQPIAVMSHWSRPGASDCRR